MSNRTQNFINIFSQSNRRDESTIYLNKKPNLFASTDDERRQLMKMARK